MRLLLARRVATPPLAMAFVSGYAADNLVMSQAGVALRIAMIQREGIPLAEVIAVHVVEKVLNHHSGIISGVAAVYNRAGYDAEKRAALDAWARKVDSVVNGEPENVVAISAKRSRRAG